MATPFHWPEVTPSAGHYVPHIHDIDFYCPQIRPRHARSLIADVVMREINRVSARVSDGLVLVWGLEIDCYEDFTDRLRVRRVQYPHNV
jgi:hypothetical protein